MPNLKHPFKFIICVLLTIFAHHPVADAQLIPYNNRSLEPKFFTSFPNQTTCAHYRHSCRWENDGDWMGNNFPAEAIGYGGVYRWDPYQQSLPFSPIGTWGYGTPPSFGSGVLDGHMLYDALVSNGLVTPLPVQISILDIDSPGHNLPRFNQIFGPVVASRINHARWVSDVLLSSNTIEPEQPAPYRHGMVGALPRELQMRRAASSGDPNGLFVSGAFMAWGQRTMADPWSLPVTPVHLPASDHLPNAVLYHAAPVVRLLAGKTLKMKETASVVGSNDCTWDAECLFGDTQNEFKLAGFSRPANVVNLSAGTQYSREEIDALLLDGANLTDKHCGGDAYQALLNDLDGTIIVTVGTNDPAIVNSLGFGCKNVVSAIGYHRYTARQTAQGNFEAIVAQSYPFTDPELPRSQIPKSMPYPGNYAAMPYGRIFYTDNALPYYIPGNSLTAPLITGMLTLMRSIHPDFQGTSGGSALQTLLVGSNKRAFVASIPSESATSGKHPQNLSVPIVAPVCMLVEGVIAKEIASAGRIAMAVGGHEVFNWLVTEHHCAVEPLPIR